MAKPPPAAPHQGTSDYVRLLEQYFEHAEQRSEHDKALASLRDRILIAKAREAGYSRGMADASAARAAKSEGGVQ